MSLQPIAYAIAKDVQAALLAISTESGYFHTLGADAVKLDPEHEVEARTAPDGQRPFVLIEVSPPTFNYQNSRSGECEVTLPLSVHWVNDYDPTSDDALLQAFFKGLADVERALSRDITRGGRAVDTRMTSATLTPVGDSAICWAEIKVEIKSWRDCGAPTEVVA